MSAPTDEQLRLWIRIMETVQACPRDLTPCLSRAQFNGMVHRGFLRGSLGRAKLTDLGRIILQFYSLGATNGQLGVQWQK